MDDSIKDDLLRRYAAGDLSWHDLRARGFLDYVEVLGGLGELDLRQPIAPMDGPNRESREHARSVVRQALRGAS